MWMSALTRDAERTCGAAAVGQAPRKQEDRSIGPWELLVELKQHPDDFIRPDCTVDEP